MQVHRGERLLERVPAAASGLAGGRGLFGRRQPLRRRGLGIIATTVKIAKEKLETKRHRRRRLWKDLEGS